MNENIDTKICQICGNNKIQKLRYENLHFKFLDKKNKNIFNNLNIFTCSDCGFSYAYPFINQALFRAYSFLTSAYLLAPAHFNYIDTKKYGNGVLFCMNGQSNGSLPPSFFSAGELKYENISKNLLVSMKAKINF